MMFLSHWPAARFWKIPFLDTFFPDEIAQHEQEYTVTTRKERFYDAEIPCHLCSVLPKEGSVIYPSNLAVVMPVASPELLFLQLAFSVESVVFAILLGCMMCSSPNNQAPLTTVEKLYEYAEGAAKVFGRPRALDALTYVRDNFESPMEIILYMLLCLPYRLGGAGFQELGNVNHSIRISREAADFLGNLTCLLRPDLLDPIKKFILEYYGEQFHSSPQAVAYDKKRTRILEDDGYRVKVVTKDDLNSLDSFEKLRSELANTLGHRIRIRTPKFARNFMLIRSKLPGQQDEDLDELLNHIKALNIRLRVR